MERSRVLVSGPLSSHETLRLILAEVKTKYLLLFPRAKQISMEPKGLERLLKAAEATEAGMVYPDFYDETGHGKTLHPLTDYQPGSVRDDFDFGDLMAPVGLCYPKGRERVRPHGRRQVRRSL